jgi:hypothetical protein
MYTQSELSQTDMLVENLTPNLHAYELTNNLSLVCSTISNRTYQSAHDLLSFSAYNTLARLHAFTYYTGMMAVSSRKHWITQRGTLEQRC